MPRLPLFVALCLLVSVPAFAQVKPKPTPLTIETIMRGKEFIGYAPTNVRWSLDSETLYFQWKEPNTPRRKDPDWYAVPKTGEGKPRKLTEDEAKAEVPPFGDLTEDRKRLVFSRDGDLFVAEAGKAGFRQITDTPSEAESAPRWTRDGKRIVFQRGLNLFVLTPDSAEPIRQLTDIRTSLPSGDSPGPTGIAKIAQDEEKRLLSVIKERTDDRAERDKKRKDEETAKKRKPFAATGRGGNIASLELSPDETQVLVTIIEDAEGRTGTASVVPRYVTETGYVNAPPGRPNVGEPQGKSRFVLLDVQTGAATPITVPDSLKDRPLSFSSARFSEGTPAKLVVQADAVNWHDEWLLTVDRTTGKTNIAYTTHDDGWTSDDTGGSYGWTLDGNALWLLTEQGTGWAHLETVNPDGTGAKPLTTGKWEVFSPTFSVGKDAFYFTSSEVDHGERDFYKMALTGGERTRLTPLAGDNDATLSPDEKTLAIIRSYTNKPPELYVQPNQPGATPKQITDTTTSAFKAYAWRDAPLVDIPSRDGVTIRARLFTPSKKTKATGAAVLFVHGAGYLQNAHRGWSTYEREYMFHNYLTDKGYTVLDVDYRGSAGYGRDVRTGIYKYMGGKDLNDLVDAAKWLVKTQKIDSKRIGLYGGSYGGFLTLMALFNASDTFACGAALRPVTDWSKYNHWYTGRILGLPQDDIEAYRKSSPIYFAEGLKGGLLICHGMVDDNVFFQDSVRLVERLIELGKDGWDCAFYPVESHGFVEPTSWADEYKRIDRLFDKYLVK